MLVTPASSPRSVYALNLMLAQGDLQPHVKSAVDMRNLASTRRNWVQYGPEQSRLTKPERYALSLARRMTGTEEKAKVLQRQLLTINRADPPMQLLMLENMHDLVTAADKAHAVSNYLRCETHVSSEARRAQLGYLYAFICGVSAEEGMHAVDVARQRPAEVYAAVALTDATLAAIALHSLYTSTLPCAAVAAANFAAAAKMWKLGALASKAKAVSFAVGGLACGGAGIVPVGAVLAVGYWFLSEPAMMHQDAYSNETWRDLMFCELLSSRRYRRSST